MAVISRTFTLLCLYLLCNASNAAVLDDDRVDLLYQSYDGGGIEVVAPAIFVRKKMAETAAISAHALSDMVSGASIDVETSGASAYEEQRDEFGLGIEFLKGKAIYTINVSQSQENDYDTQSVSAAISQDFFGDLTNLSMSVSYADSEVGKTGSPEFSEKAKQYAISLGISQILTKHLITSLTINKSIDEGYLQNPYRWSRYRDNSDNGWGIEYIDEQGDWGFPEIRTSDALALTLRYFIQQDHVIYGGMRYFEDSFEIQAWNIDIGYNFRYQQRWIFDISLRHYQQSAAEFYSDLFDFPSQTEFRSRDKELSTLNNNMLSFSVSYDLPLYASWIKKSSVHAHFDYNRFSYDDFSDLRETGYAAGDEPAYQFSTTMIRLMYSLWF